MLSPSSTQCDPGSSIITTIRFKSPFIKNEAGSNRFTHKGRPFLLSGGPTGGRRNHSLLAQPGESPLNFPAPLRSVTRF